MTDIKQGCDHDWGDDPYGRKLRFCTKCGAPLPSDGSCSHGQARWYHCLDCKVERNRSIDAVIERVTKAMSAFVEQSAKEAAAAPPQSVKYYKGFCDGVARTCDTVSFAIDRRRADLEHPV